MVLQDIREFMHPLWRWVDERLYWLIVGNLPETFDALFHTLQTRGKRVPSLAWMPNDYPQDEVLAFLRDLAARRPMQSARWGLRRRCGFVLAAAIVPVAAAMVAAPAAATMATGVLLSSVFGAWLALRLAGAIIGGRAPPPPRPLPDSALPVYTIIAALYREAASVAGLLAAIGRLDYPPEKLDVVVAVEADDGDTRAALDTAKPKFPITVLPVPPQGPRTKPKALNVALPFARGTYTVIYDAEDRPDPGQLRVALQAFLAGPANLACVQARLCVDNTEDGWLSGYFTAEYAGQFDVFMPGLATMGLPLPLGGSSNHFHTKTLREAGAWDPFNVTEDADLGMRLARFGYLSGVIDSTTYEEAPARLGAWLPQRTRWCKGWLQTWLVHMRYPLTTLRELGPGGFAIFQSAEDGLRALGELLRSYARRGLNTVRGVINRWAPPTENDTGAYVGAVAKRLGVGEDQALNMSDPKVIAGLSAEITRHENGRNPFSPEAILGASGGGARQISVAQTNQTNITVTGVNDPQAAGRAVRDEQVGVKAPGSEKTTTVLFLNRSSVVTFFQVLPSRTGNVTLGTRWPSRFCSMQSLLGVAGSDQPPWKE